MPSTVTLSLTTAPYPGLRAFRASETDIFFGRESQVDRLLARLRSSHFLAVVGPSGCGKSSLVRAGLISALEAGFLAEVGSRWKIAEMRPGADPFGRLAASLRTVLDRTPTPDPAAVAFTAATLRRGPLGLVEALRESPFPAGANLLVLVDQFEEMFRYQGERSHEEASAFVALLLASFAQRQARIYVAITMRSDFLGDCTYFTGLPEAISDNQFLTPRLTREELAHAIAMPARVFGGEVDSALVTCLLNEMGADAAMLPVLQHALMRMWLLAEARAGGKAGARHAPVRMTLADYEAIGTLRGSLSRHATDVYSALDPDGRRIAELMFKRLTERALGARDTRRLATVADIAAMASDDISAVCRVADQFRQPDRAFLAPPPPIPLDDDTMLDIGHEALIARWALLDTWATAEARSANMYRRLRDTAALWKQHEAEPWSGTDLQRAVRWHDREKPTGSWAVRYGTREDWTRTEEFLAVSRQAEETRLRQQHRNRTVKWIAASLIPTVVVLGIWLLSYHRRTGLLEALNQQLSERTEELKAAAAIETGLRHEAERLRGQESDLRQLAETRLEETQKLQRIAEETLLEEARQRELANLRLAELRESRESAANPPVRTPAGTSGARKAVAERVRPIRPGVSIGGPGYQGAPISAATLCCFARNLKTGARYGITLSHSLGTTSGMPVTQPSVIDGGRPNDRIGTLVVPDRSIDVVLVELLPSINISLELPVAGKLTGVKDRVEVGEQLYLVGRGSGAVSLTVTDTRATTKAMGPGGPITLRNTVMTTRGSRPGDSGAPVYDRAGRLVGLLWGDSSEASVVVPIRSTLERFGLELLLSP
jgi:hypothetical protein